MKRVITILMSLFVAFSVNAQIKDFVIVFYLYESYNQELVYPKV